MNIQAKVIASVAAWFLAVCVTAQTGLLALVPMPAFAAIVTIGIATPYLLYGRSPALQAWVREFGLENITLLHVWRIPAALMFFYYGSQGKLPPTFWIIAGVGDLIAGSLAATRWRPLPWLSIKRIHTFGMADFVAAVGTGLAFTLLGDPRMNTLQQLPMALIPLFGVGISGATHLMAFDIMRRQEKEVTDSALSGSISRQTRPIAS